MTAEGYIVEKRKVRSGEHMESQALHEFLRKLDAARISYSLTSAREGAIMVQIALPGERWEVEFFDDRPAEIEVFRSDGDIYGPEKLGNIFGETKADGG